MARPTSASLLLAPVLLATAVLTSTVFSGNALAAPLAPEELTPQQSLVLPLRSTYIAMPEEMATNYVPIFAPGGPALPIYLNRWGGTYTFGADNSSTNTSSIVQGNSATISQFSGTDTQWNEVLTCVQEQFSAFNAYVVDQEPTSGAYIEAVIAGSPNELGMPWGVGGVAPFDPYGCNIIDRAVVYAFADVYLQGGWGGGTRALCETATQEIAHSMTLDHVLICEDPMTYLNGCGQKNFQDEYGACGEDTARACSCERPSQNSVQVLMEILGPSDGTIPPPPPVDNESPVVSLLNPADGAVFSVDEDVIVTAQADDDVGLTVVQLYWAYNDIYLPCPAQGGGWSCTKSGNEYTWRVSPGIGARDYWVEARDVAGNLTVTETRMVSITEDGAPPPPDFLPPEITIVSPMNNAQLQENSQIAVVATASDDGGIATVGLIWDFSENAFPCPVESETVNCTVDGSTYTWLINVGQGTRTFRAVAIDIVGNQVVSEDRSITLVASPGQVANNDEYEENDTWDQATTLACGEELSLIAIDGDDDWFRVTVPSEQAVRVQLGGEVADSLTVSVRSGPFSGTSMADASGTEVVEIFPDVEEVGILITAPQTDTYGTYSLVVNCLTEEELLPPATETPDPGAENPGTGLGLPGCSAMSVTAQTLPQAALLSMLFIGLAFVRRRRQFTS